MNRAVIRQGIFITAVLLFLPGGMLRGETEMVTRAGIMKEMTDFEEGISDTVIKGGVSFSIDDLYRFSCTYMRNNDTGGSTATWYMRASGGRDPWEFVLGSYSLHYGTGIVMGKKQYMRPDPFSRSLGFTRDDPYSPAEGGNPANSFYGITACAGLSGEYYGLRIVPFYSIQRRYLKEEDVAEGRISSSLYAVNQRTVESGEYVSPADIISSGGAVCVDLADIFHVQMYGFFTGLSSAGGERILWECGEAWHGTSSVQTGGIFAEYRDESISLFIEHDLVTREGSGGNIPGRCTGFGFSLKNEMFRFGLSAKLSDRDFRSVQGSGDTGAENVIEAAGSAAWKYFAAGAAFYSEKDLTVSPGSDERRCFMREEVSCSLRGIETFGADLRFSRKLPMDGNGEERAEQYSAGITFTPHKLVYFKVKYTGQFNSAGGSHLYSGEMKLMFSEFFSLSAGGMYVSATGDNPLYAVVSPAAENTMDIGRFTSSGNGCAVKLRYCCSSDSFYFRWSRLSSGGTVEYNAESALVLVF